MQDEPKKLTIFILMTLIVIFFVFLLSSPGVTSFLKEKYISITGNVIEVNQYDGLVAYYPLDYDSKDALGNNPGIVYGDAHYSRDGKINSAFIFDGSDDYIEIPDADIFSLQDEMSISLWIKPSTYNFQSYARDYSSFLGKSNSGGQSEYKLRLYNSSKIGVLTYNLIGGINAEAKTEMSNNAWTHIVAVINKTDILIYRDSILEGTDSLQNNNINLGNGYAPLRIGTSDKTNFFNGSIDELRIYNKALSSQDILDLYNDIPKTISCYSNSDCGIITSTDYCFFSSLCINTIAFSCNNPGTPESFCSTASHVECTLCDSGCENDMCVLKSEPNI